MSDKKINLPVILVVASLLTGCAVSQSQYSPWRKDVNVRRGVVSQVDLATFNDAILLVESLRYEEAAGKFRQVFDNFVYVGDRRRAAEALFWLGFCREKQQRPADAKAIYLRLADKYAGTRAAGEGAKRLSRLPNVVQRPPDGDHR